MDKKVETTGQEVIADCLPIRFGGWQFLGHIFIFFLKIACVVAMVTSLGIIVGPEYPVVYHLDMDTFIVGAFAIAVFILCFFVFLFMQGRFRKFWSSYWYQNARGCKLVCWCDEEGEQLWRVIGLFDSLPIPRSTTDGIVVALGGWFRCFNSGVYFRDQWGNELQRSAKIILQSVDTREPLQTVVVYKDGKTETIKKTISKLLDFLEYNNRRAIGLLTLTVDGLFEEVAKLRQEREELRRQQDELAIQLQKQAEASREFVNQLLATHAEEIKRRSVWEATMVDVLWTAIDMIKKTTRFFASTKGKEIRVWLEKQFLVLAPLDDKRREVLEHKKPAPEKSAPKESISV